MAAKADGGEEVRLGAGNGGVGGAQLGDARRQVGPPRQRVVDQRVDRRVDLRRRRAVLQALDRERPIGGQAERQGQLRLGVLHPDARVLEIVDRARLDLARQQQLGARRQSDRDALLGGLEHGAGELEVVLGGALQALRGVEPIVGALDAEDDVLQPPIEGEVGRQQALARQLGRLRAAAEVEQRVGQRRRAARSCPGGSSASPSALSLRKRALGLTSARALITG